MQQHFKETFGVDVTREDSFYLFKYGIDAKWSLPLTHQCRGTILHFDGKWEFASRPLDKFFNLHEGFCELFDPTKLKVGALYLAEKADGTCIQAWYDKWETKSWRFSTLGKITPENVNDFNINFDGLFKKTVGTIDSLINSLDPEYTYVFELCCAMNKIVTTYNKDKVYLLAGRHTNKGYFLDEAVLNKIASSNGLSRPIHIYPDSKAFDSHQALVNYVNTLELSADDVGKTPEGVVVYRGGRPIAKIKRADYVALHSMVGGAVCLRHIAEAYFSGKADDISDERVIKYIDAIKAKINHYKLELNKFLDSIEGKKFYSRKEYAIAVQQADKTIRPFLFNIVGGAPDCIQYFAPRNGINIGFDIWIHDNWVKLEHIWRN